MIRAQRTGLSQPPPSHVIPTVKAMIPNAQMAVPTTYGRSGIVGRASSETRFRATANAMAPPRR